VGQFTIAAFALTYRRTLHIVSTTAWVWLRCCWWS